ncbi:sensor histidine kinase [Nocardia paucivorans]|uniref:sensor histidine kinase n=1 Tax=Nocardia paucivorans TaxID=114259 RepID=UPI001FE072E4|nr:sensor histidine kinase [Nocardia paucivorans]
MAGARLESELEMRDAARSGRKRWALSNWDLRWKVTAVLAVPLAVAVGLGVSRISSQWSEANRLAAAAENVGIIPTVTGLSAATSTVAGSAVITLAPGRSLVTDENITTLDKALAAAEAAVGELSDVPEAQQAFTEMIDGAKAVRANGKAPSPLPPAEAAAQIDSYRSAGVRTVEAIVSEVSASSIDPSKLRLVDSLNARSAMLGEVVAVAEIMRDPVTGVQSYLASANTGRTLVNILSHRYSADDPDIGILRQGIEARVGLVTGPETQAGRLPIGEARQSLLSSLDTTEKLVAEATAAIDGGVQEMADRALRDAIVYSIVVLLTILAALLLAVFVARSMIVPLHRLRLAALRVAESDLPEEVAELRNGASPEQVPLEPMPIRSDEEIGQLARAIDDIHGQALRLASDQAQMRSQVNDMFETLARRSKSLVDHQLTLIEAMEYDEKDPRLLENLFRLDHLAARMRRNGDNLLILAGTKQRRAKSAPVEIADVLRAAISEVEDYERVKLGATPRGALVEPAASDIAHLFAELLDNALRASPPETDVKFTFAQAHDQGLLIEVADRGIGMPPAEMAEINRRLESTAEPGPDTARHMGLFVVGRLAERHGLTVRLRPTFDTARDPGVTVTVHIPLGLIVAGQTQILPLASASGPQPAVPKPEDEKKAAEVGPKQPTAASAMQTRGISRTPGGNVMVTVDPGMSGPIPVTERPGTVENRPGPTPSRPAASTGPNGLPQRQPGSAMAGGLRGQGEQSATSLRSANTGSMPQRGKLAAASLPKRNLGPGTPQPPRSGDTPSESSTGGIPPQDSARDLLTQRRPGASGPSAEGPTGLPQRRPGANGVPPRDGGADDAAVARETSTPQVSRGAGGLPQRRPTTPGTSANGRPSEESAAGPLPQRGGDSGGPSRDPLSGPLPQRGGDSGGPSRDPLSGPLPQGDSGSTGLPRRDQAASGLPRREPGTNSAPTRDAAASGLPRRDTGAVPPPRETTGGIPRREPAPEGLPQRGPGGGLPQRGVNGVPQRPQPAGAEASAPAPELPNRGGRPAGPTGLPQRSPGATRMPDRTENPPGVALPRRSAEPTAGDRPGAGGEGGAARDQGRHSHRSNPAKTASFFQTRLQPAEENDGVMGGTPIFAEMMSAWLADPNADRSQVAASFESPGDEGWQAARRVSEEKPETRTAAGLPQRNPGGRLIPGGVSGAAERTPTRNPELIRSSLSRHQQGVRDGRAMRAMNLTGDKGDR